MAVLAVLAETVVIQVHPQVVRFLTKQNGVGRLMGHREDLHGILHPIMLAVLQPIMQAAV